MFSCHWDVSFYFSLKNSFQHFLSGESSDFKLLAFFFFSLGKFSFLLPIWRIALLNRDLFADHFFLSTLHIGHSMLFWLVGFLLIAKWNSFQSYNLFFFWLLLGFFLCLWFFTKFTIMCLRGGPFYWDSRVIY